MLNFQARSPSPHLSHIVLRYMVVDGEIPEGQAFKSLMAPNGTETWCFSLCEKPHRTYFGDFGQGLVMMHGLQLLGNYAHGFHVHLSGKVRYVAVSLKSPGLYQLLNIPANHFTQTAVSAEDVLGHEIKFLNEQLIESGDCDKAIIMIETLLTSLLLRSKARVSGRLPDSMSLIHQSLGSRPIHEIAKELRVSERTLQKKFIEQVGISPKHYSRTIRFNQVIREMKDQNHSWQNSIERLGYFDQAHFIKDFRDIMRVNPTKFVDEYEAVNRFFSNY